MQTCIVFLSALCLASAFAFAAPQIDFLPGSSAESQYLMDNNSYLVQNKETARVADKEMHWTYRLPLLQGHAEYAKIQIANQYLISISTDNRTWKTIFDCQQLGQAPGALSIDLTDAASSSNTVYLRFQDRYPENGWGPYLTHFWLYDLGKAAKASPLSMDISNGWKINGKLIDAGSIITDRYSKDKTILISRNVLLPSDWNDAVALYFPGAEATSKIYWNSKLIGIAPAGQEDVLPIPVTKIQRKGTLLIKLTRNPGARIGLMWPIRLGLLDIVSNPQPIRRFDNAILPLERRYAPYDLTKLNWLSGNYLQSILDRRNNLLPFTTDNNGHPSSFHYVHDNARVLAALADEERYTPVVRLQLAERLFRGVTAARLPGSEPNYSMKLDPQPLDIHPETDGKYQVLYHQDVAEPVCLLSTSIFQNGKQLPLVMQKMIPHAADKPAIFKEVYPSLPNSFTDFSYGYGSPLTAPYTDIHLSPGLSAQIQVDGLAQKGQWFIPYTWGPDSLTLPNGVSSGALLWKNPSFSWLIIRGDNTGDYTFSRALTVGWTGSPSEVQCVKEGKHIARVVITYKNAGTRSARVWVMPFDAVPPSLEYPRTMANLLKQNNGMVDTHGFDPVRTLYRDYTICAGFASAAYLFHKYHLPEYPMALKLAKESVDHYMTLQNAGVQSNELYFPIAACQYLVLAGQPQYQTALRFWADRVVDMQSEDGSWSWLNFQLRCMIALLRAYDTTGDKRYLSSFQRAERTVQVRGKSLFWKGAPTSIEETFAGALLLANLGHQGDMKDIPAIISIADEGSLGDYGSCRCSDLNEYALGFSAKGLHLPLKPKYILSLKDFVIYNSKKVKILHHPTAAVKNLEYPVPGVVVP
jgi:hypothetical protein